MFCVDLAPALPAEHGGSVAQNDLTGRAFGAGREIGLSARGHCSEHVLFRAGDAVDLGHEVARDLIEYCAEQLFLGLEVVIDGALGDPRAGRNVVHRRRRKAALAKNALRRLDDRGSGFFAPFALRCHAFVFSPVPTRCQLTCRLSVGIYRLSVGIWRFAMPTLATLQAFAATVEANDHVGAIAKFYAPDAATRENNNPPTVGRDVLAEKERRTLASVAGVATTRLGPLFLDGDHSAICWRVQVSREEGSEPGVEEIGPR